MKSFFDESEALQGYQRDTFPEFKISVNDPNVSSSWSMRLVMEYYSSPGTAVFSKQCTYSDTDGVVFYVQLDTEDTKQLCGSYNMHFILTDPNGLEYHRLTVLLTVIPSPTEVQQ